MTGVVDNGHICVASLIGKIAQRAPHLDRLKIPAGLHNVKTCVL
ncbi:hypothetical protein CDS [Bradyrhizobium sp.]|nr:hypothetical protein CDS [Bradyrhizobium sp.]